MISSAKRSRICIPEPFGGTPTYPAFPKAIRLGEAEATDERKVIEKAVKKLEQDPAKLIAMWRP
jgi:hypothetical protein